MSKARAVIFDWAGTLVDYGSLSPVYAFQNAFRSVGVELSIADIRADMGKTKREHISEILRNKKVNHNIEYIYRMFSNELTKTIGERSNMIDGIPQALKELRKAGIQLGSCTGYTQNMLLPLSNMVAMETGIYLHSVASDQVTAGRPFPYMMWRLAEQMQLPTITPETVVKVGDTVVDIHEGLNANAFTVGVTLTGNEAGLSQQELCNMSDAEKTKVHDSISRMFRSQGAHATIRSVAELPTLLKQTGHL
jgi:phosphonoacetaldehyde hydrolase